MSKSLTISFILIFYYSFTFAQSNVNSYKYILIPKQFEFQKAKDQHQLNSLTKFLFEKAGFTAFFTDDKYPNDLANNGCLALKVKINNNPSLFKTKMNIDLLDCHNKVIYSTKEAMSKKKEYKKAYHEAIRRTFVDLEELNYVYEAPSVNSQEKVIKKNVVVTTIKEDKKPTTETVSMKNEVTGKVNSKEVVPVTVTKPVVSFEESKKVVQEPKVEKTFVKTIEGKFNIDNWGISTITKKGSNYVVVGGDEDFEFAIIYKTSKPTLFIIKWAAYKQPQLLEINSEGDLSVDNDKGVKIYKRIY